MPKIEPTTKFLFSLISGNVKSAAELRHLYSVNLNAQLPNGEYPLEIAIQYGRIEMMLFLLLHGANLDPITVEHIDSMESVPQHAAKRSLLKLIISLANNSSRPLLFALVNSQHSHELLIEEDNRQVLFLALRYLYSHQREISNKTASDWLTELHDLVLSKLDNPSIENYNHVRLVFIILEIMEQALLPRDKIKVMESFSRRWQKEITQTASILRLRDKTYIQLAMEWLKDPSSANQAARLFPAPIVTLSKDVLPELSERELTTELMVAIALNHTETVKIILSDGRVKLNQEAVMSVSLPSDTPLNCAMKYERREIAEWLIASGALVNLPNSRGDFPLYVAASHDASQVVNLLLEKEADVCQVHTVTGKTMLEVACEKVNLRFLRALFTLYSYEPLAHAVQAALSERTQSIVCYFLSQLKLNTVADASLEHSFRMAVQHQNFEEITSILVAGYTPTTKDLCEIIQCISNAEYNDRPLGLTCFCISMCLCNDINGYHPVTGLTPLITAIQCGIASLISPLLSKGANPNQAARNGVPPLCYALHNEEAFDILLQHHADPDYTPFNGLSTRWYADALKAHAISHPEIEIELQRYNVLMQKIEQQLHNRNYLPAHTSFFDKLSDEQHQEFVAALMTETKESVSRLRAYTTFCRLSPEQLADCIPPVLEDTTSRHLSFLLRLGADVHRQDYLTLALDRGNVKNIHLLIQNGADPFPALIHSHFFLLKAVRINEPLFYALAEACEKHHHYDDRRLERLRLALNEVLLHAASHNLQKLAHTLLRCGADKHYRGTENKNALELALAADHHELSTFIRLFNLSFKEAIAAGDLRSVRDLLLTGKHRSHALHALKEVQQQLVPVTVELKFKQTVAFVFFNTFIEEFPFTFNKHSLPLLPPNHQKVSTYALLDFVSNTNNYKVLQKNDGEITPEMYNRYLRVHLERYNFDSLLFSLRESGLCLISRALQSKAYKNAFALLSYGMTPTIDNIVLLLQSISENEDTKSEKIKLFVYMTYFCRNLNAHASDQLAGTTPLIQAITSNLSFCVSWLIDNKVDVNFASARGVTPLEAARDNPSLIKKLIWIKADINQKFSTGCTPISYLVKRVLSHLDSKADEDLIKEFLEAGVNLKISDTDGGGVMMTIAKDIAKAKQLEWGKRLPLVSMLAGYTMRAYQPSTGQDDYCNFCYDIHNQIDNFLRHPNYVITYRDFIQLTFLLVLHELLIFNPPNLLMKIAALTVMFNHQNFFFANPYQFNATITHIIDEITKLTLLKQQEPTPLSATEIETITPEVTVSSVRFISHYRFFNLERTRTLLSTNVDNNEECVDEAYAL